jgi:hypothetical protein
MRFFSVVASATFLEQAAQSFLSHAVCKTQSCKADADCPMNLCIDNCCDEDSAVTKAVEDADASVKNWDPICSWAQAFLTAGCNEQYPDHSTGCAMGTVTGKPFTKDMQSTVYCLPNNQPFLHYGNPQCSYNSDSQGHMTVSFNCEWLVQPAGIAAIVGSILLCCGCIACVCRGCSGRRRVYIYR